MKVFVVLCVLIAVTNGELAPFKQASEDRLPGRYIVKLKDSVSVDAFIRSAEFTRLNVHIRHTYTLINGISVEIPADYIDKLRSLPGIEVIYEVALMHAMANVASWGIDRIDQRSYPLDDKFTTRSDGTGVDIYVLDTGIRLTHNDFGGRAKFFWDFEKSNGGVDCNGHGTHCTGTAGGATYGIARGATLYAGRVLNCFGFGTWDDLIKALDLVALETGNRVVSLSLGGGRYDIVDDAVDACIKAGVVIAIAAGNNYNDACHYTPARTPSAITVGSVVYLYDQQTGIKYGDTRAESSNYGTCLDIFAPGMWIQSAWHTYDDASANLSGTSMATPHVAGVAALHMQEGIAAANVRDAIVADATVDAIEEAGPNSPNLLLYVHPA